MARLARLKFFLLALGSLVVTAVAVWMVIIPPGSGEPDPAYQLEQFKAGGLTGQALNDAVTFALAVQAERNWNHPRYPHWSPAWGEFIEATHARGVDTPTW